MSEGHTYRCSWSLTTTGYRLWVVADPDLVREDAGFAEAAQELSYLELLGGEVHAPFVALRGIGVTLSECRVCGWQRPPFYSVEAPTPAQFVASRALPDRIPSAVCVGPTQQPQLCLSAARWKALSKKRATRLLMSDAVGVACDFAVDRSPRYELD